MNTIELPDGELELTINNLNYTICEEGDNVFTIMDDDENMAEVKVSESSEFYEYNYSPLYKDFDNCSGCVPINQFDSIVQFFIWTIKNV